jgi:indolepyruvate decarboxylase
MGKYGVNPIILLLNNGTFGVEEIVMGNSNPDKVHAYNKLAPWQHHKLPEAMGCRDWSCTRVETNAQFELALQNARKQPGASYIELLLGPKMVALLPPEIIDGMYQTKTPPMAS